jgi:predicted RNA-binding Zn-ribbon protein involved in translation (DUF1610 family)
MRRYRYYEVLGLNRNATIKEIKEAYHNLAFKYHPDKNPNPEAHKKIININQAYEVLSNPLRRVEYDSSPAECPFCWTYEVVQTVESSWKCRRCHCQFDFSGTTEIIDEIEGAAIPERQKKYMRLFQTTQCSWCKKFYTQPFLCPNELLESNCLSFDRLNEGEREVFLKDEMWWWRMQDMIMRAGERGMLGRCRKCFALNPNPQKRTCWNCGEDTLECPARLKDGTICKTLLRYDIEKNDWKCISAGCSKTYEYRRKEPPVKLQQDFWIDIEKQLKKYWESKDREVQNYRGKRQETPKEERKQNQESQRGEVGMSYCPSCGKQVPEHAKYCRRCGLSLYGHTKSKEPDGIKESGESTYVKDSGYSDGGIVHNAYRCDIQLQLDLKCPRCGKETIIRKSTKGKHIGKRFYLCENYSNIPGEGCPWKMLIDKD